MTYAELRAAGMCVCCCRVKSRPGKAHCPTCAERYASRERKSYGERYRPLDEILATPRMRLLRGLARFDGAESGEILLALNVPDDDCAERNTYRKALWMLVKGGYVAVDVTPFQINYFSKQHRIYRITQLGRDLLRRTFDDYQQRLGEGVAA